MDRKELSKYIHQEMMPIGGYIMLLPEAWDEIAKYVYELERDSKRLADVKEYVYKLEQELKELNQRPAQIEPAEHIAGAKPTIHIDNLCITVNHFKDTAEE